MAKAVLSGNGSPPHTVSGNQLDNMAKKNQAWKRRRQALRDKRLKAKHRSRKFFQRNNQSTSGPTLMERLMAGQTLSAEEIFREIEARR